MGTSGIKNKILKEGDGSAPGLTGTGWIVTNRKQDYKDSDGVEWTVKKGTDGKFYKKKKSVSSDFPEWANDLKSIFDRLGYNLKPTTSSEQVISTEKNSRWFFVDDGKFIYFSGGTGPVEVDTPGRINGTWKIEDGELRVDTEDGEYWTSTGKEWVTPTEDEDPEEEDLTLTPTVDCSPFNDKTEADNFRIWVNTNYPNIANEIPNLPSSETDRKLSKKGNCNTIHIKTASEYEIEGDSLLELFRAGMTPQIKVEDDDVKKLKDFHKKGELKDGLYIKKVHGKWAYMKQVPSVSEYPNKRYFKIYYPELTWESFVEGVGWWKQGKWKPSQNATPNDKPITVLESKIMKEQDEYDELDNKDKITTPSQNTVKTDVNKSSSDSPLSKEQQKSFDDLTTLVDSLPDDYNLGDAISTEKRTETSNFTDNFSKFLRGELSDNFGYKIPKIEYFVAPGAFNEKKRGKEEWRTVATPDYSYSFMKKKYCKRLVDYTYDAFKIGHELEKPEHKKMIKDVLTKCEKTFGYGGGNKTKYEKLIYDKSLGLRENKILTNKIMKDTLSNTIKKNLSEIRDTKKDKLVQEHIIKTKLKKVRLTNEDYKGYFGKLLKEFDYLSNKDFNNQVLNESLIELIDVLYKEKGKNVKTALNSEASRFISDRLKLEDGSYLRSIIRKIFTSNSIEETVKLFNDCDYLCNMVSDEITNSLGFSEENMKVSFSKNIKSEIKSMICPIIDSMGDKMENQYRKMKSKALSK
jgi:hypothetical protein